MEEIFDNRQYLYVIPEKVLFDSDLNLNDLKVYALIRSASDFYGYVSPTDRDVNFLSFMGHFSPDNFLMKALNMEEKMILECINKLIDKDYFRIIEEKYISI